MKNRKKEAVTDAGFQAEAVTDLPVVDKSAEEVKAGQAGINYRTVSGKITAVVVDE